MRTYVNPVWPGYFADPFVFRGDVGWCAVGTGDDGRTLAGLSSADLVTWQPWGPVLEPATVLEGATHCWAPEVVQRDGAFWLYYSAGVEDRGHRLRVARAERAQGPYADCGVVLTESEPFAIDPHPFRDDDGQWYLFHSVDRLEGERVGTVIVVDRLLTPDRLAGRPQAVVTPSADWQVFERQRAIYGQVVDWHTCEGPFVVKRGGRYWCLYSGGNWQNPTYGVAAVHAPTPLGPWREARPGASVVRTRPGVAHGPGHASVVTDASGADWLVYHAWDPAGKARRMHLDPLRWSADGPVCEGPTVGEPRPAPALAAST